MVSFEQMTLAEDIPIYLQIIQFVKREIAAGHIRNQDEMPSRRVLSALLGVNPNTIQKAYRMLEDEQIIESRSGAKSYVVLTEEQINLIREELLDHDARTVVTAMKQMNISRDEALALIMKYWTLT